MKKTKTITVPLPSCALPADVARKVRHQVRKSRREAQLRLWKIRVEQVFAVLENVVNVAVAYLF